MTASAILLMVLAIILVWGGLAASMALLFVLDDPEVELDSLGNVVDQPLPGE